MDTVEPSAFARGILNSQPYTFLDDAPLEERRTQAVISRRVLDTQHGRRAGRARSRRDRARARRGVAAARERRGGPRGAPLDGLRHGRGGAAVAAVARRARGGAGASCARATAGSPPRRRGSRRRSCAAGWRRSARSRATIRCCSELEAEGVVLRTRIGGRQAWCDRRLLARIHRYTLDRLRQEIEPVTAAQFLRFLACWQHVDPEHRLEGPRGVARGRRAARRLRGPRGGLGGERAPGARARLPARVARSAHALGRGRLGAALGLRAPVPIRRTPICLVRARAPRCLDGARGGGAGPRADRPGARGAARPWLARRDVPARSWRGPRSCRRRSSRRASRS